jgi:beta-galactosidase
MRVLVTSCLGVVIMVGSALSVHAETDPRTLLDMNPGWRFTLADEPGFATVDFDDSTWQALDLPHTWNQEDVWDDEPGYTRAIGWYRKRIKLAEPLGQRRAVLRIGAANQVADVYVDGQHRLHHVGGYSALAVDLTEALQGDHQAVVAVKVDNRWNAAVPPLNADFTFYGGIYRDVQLILTDAVHFDLLDRAGPGITIDTPQVKQSSATVRIRGGIVNDTGTDLDLTITSTLHDPAGTKVAQVISRARSAANAASDFTHKHTIKRPLLWSPDSPQLYTATVEIRSAGQVRDRKTVPLGLRFYRFDPDEGFILNGQPLSLRGTNRHQDRAGQGVVLTAEQHVEDLQIIKQMGANFVRLAHYPQDDAVLEAADRMGLLIWEEIPVVNYVTPSDEFTANCREMLRDMIRQHYNHPSIILWGYMNEIYLFGPDGKYTDQQKDPEYAKWVVKLARELEAIVHAEDPYRVTAMAGHGHPVYDDFGLTAVPQVWGWNVYYGWYVFDFDFLSKFLDEQHEKYPQRVLMVSEYGAGSDRRLHSDDPQRFDFSIEWQQRLHESYVKQFAERPWLAGVAIWNQFDFCAEQRGDSIPHLNQKGVCDYERRPKELYHFYRAAWGDQPALLLAVRDWLERVLPVKSSGAKTAFEPQTMVVYTNQPAVELLLNGESLGVQQRKPGEFKLSWQVTWREGENKLHAVVPGETTGESLEDHAVVTVRAMMPNPPTRLAVNVGCSATHLGSDGTHWLADRAYDADYGWGYLGQCQTHVGGGPSVAETIDDALYQSHARNLTGYRFDVPDGKYDVQFHFAECGSTKPGERVFGITINEQPVAGRVDIVNAVGRAKPMIVQCQAEARQDQGLQIAFTPVKGEALLCGLRVIPASAEGE